LKVAAGLLALTIGHIASAQSVDARVDSLLHRMSLEEKVGEMTQVDLSVVAAVRGTASRRLQIAMAATWNPMLVRREQQVTAYEPRAGGVAWNFAPVLDLGRQPMWSRFFETFGEDPWLTSVLGATAVEAEQDDPVAAVDSLLRGSPMRMLGPPTPPPASPRADGPIFIATTGNSFIGYSVPLSGRDRTMA
jgi:hypothetical protein